MAGDTTNTFLWSEADVYVAPLGSTPPADANDAFDGSWDLVGILDGTEGFTESRSEDTTDLFGWGGILLRTTRKNFKLTKTFTALEKNEVTHALQWPGSDDDGNGTLIVPRPIRQLIAFETRDVATGQVHRVISINEAEIDLNGDVAENEDSIAGLPFIATIFPNGNGELFTEQTVEGS